jgi:hypothetical protein
VQEEGRTFPLNFGPLRLSRIFSQTNTTSDPEAVPPGRALLWLAFGLIVIVGVVLYFKYERLVMPLLT